MEMIFVNNNVEFKDVCKWSEVKCDSGQLNVLEIEWGFRSLKGTMDPSWIPPIVTYFSISMNNITGTLGAAL